MLLETPHPGTGRLGLESQACPTLPSSSRVPQSPKFRALFLLPPPNCHWQQDVPVEDILSVPPPTSRHLVLPPPSLGSVGRLSHRPPPSSPPLCIPPLIQGGRWSQGPRFTQPPLPRQPWRRGPQECLESPLPEAQTSDRGSEQASRKAKVERSHWPGWGSLLTRACLWWSQGRVLT